LLLLSFSLELLKLLGGPSFLTAAFFGVLFLLELVSTASPLLFAVTAREV
jgi:hypothetical protein